jgi:uncharacterized protein YbaA (DUF1428 family)
MNNVDGFVCAVADANQEAYRAHAYGGFPQIVNV